MSRTITITDVDISTINIRKSYEEDELIIYSDYIPVGVDEADPSGKEKPLDDVFPSSIEYTGWGGTDEEPTPDGKSPTAVWAGLLTLYQWVHAYAWRDASLGPVAPIGSSIIDNMTSEDVLSLFEYEPFIKILRDDPDLCDRTIKRLGRIIDKLQVQDDG